MTDTAVNPNHLTVDETDHPSRQLYVELWNQISDIDEKLDAGTEAAGKRAITNGLVNAAESEWTPALKNAVDAFKTLLDSGDLDTFTGTYFGFIRGLSSEFKETADNRVSELLEAQPKSDDAASEDEKAELSAARSALMKQIKPIIEMGAMFNQFTEDNAWPLPKRRGAQGKRGRRALSFYEWTVDGEDFEDNDTVKGVADVLGITRGEFTKALRDADVNTKEPPDTISVTVAGKAVVGTRIVEDEEDETEEASEPSVSEDDE